MNKTGVYRKFGLVAVAAAVLLLGGCETPLPYADQTELGDVGEYEYIIGPGDSLGIFVWRNPELSQSVIVRPDGKISAPLVEDLIATGKTSTALAREIESVLATYVRDPLVTVIVDQFSGVYETQVRVVGEATEPAAVPYRANMTLLDLMITVGGLTEFADGNSARLVRTVNGESQSTLVRIDDLLKDGDISANVNIAPGDIVIIPEAWF